MNPLRAVLGRWWVAVWGRGASRVLAGLLAGALGFGGFGLVAPLQAQTGPAQAWAAWPEAPEPPLTVHADALYNHQPVISQDLDGSWVLLWVGHDREAREGAPGQRVYHARSVDGGLSWSARQPWLSGRFFDPAPPAPLHSEWQPRARRVQGDDGQPQWWAVYTLSRTSADAGAWLVTRRAPGRPLQRALLMQDALTGQIEAVPAAEVAARQQAGPDRWRTRWQVQGRAWFPFVQSLTALGPGRVLFTLTLIDPQAPFAQADKRFASVRFAQGRFGAVALPEPGVVAPTDAWESAVWQPAPGRLQALVRSNDIRRPPGQRMAVTESFDDGAHWAPLRWSNLSSHTEQPALAALGPGQALLSLPDHSFHRNNRALTLLHGEGGVAALPVSQEPDRLAYAHTADVAVDPARGLALVAWSEGPVDGVPQRILLRRQPLAVPADARRVVLRANAAYERDQPGLRAHWRSPGGVLVVPQGASAGLELRPGPQVLRLAFEPPGGDAPRVLATLGGFLQHHLWRWQRGPQGDEVVELLAVQRDGTRLDTQLLAREPARYTAGPAGRRLLLSLAVTLQTPRSSVQWAGRDDTVLWPGLLFLGDAHGSGPARRPDAPAVLGADLAHSEVLPCGPAGCIR